MAQRKIEGSTMFERIAHWALAISCLALFLTGFGLMFKSWAWIPAFFGGTARMKAVHDWCSWVFMGSLVLSLVVWAKDCLPEDGDGKWLSNFGGYLSSKPVHFESGKFNAGQKLFFWLANVIGGALISLSGFAMMYPDKFTPDTVRLAGSIHVLFTAFMGMFVVAHIYLGTIGNPGTAAVMFSGKVSRAWAKTHRSKWLKKQESGA